MKREDNMKMYNDIEEIMKLIEKLNESDLIMLTSLLGKYYEKITNKSLCFIDYNAFQDLKKKELENRKRIKKVVYDLRHELNDHILIGDEVTWNCEYYTNGKLDYRKLLIALLQQTLDTLANKKKEDRK